MQYVNNILLFNSGNALHAMETPRIFCGLNSRKSRTCSLSSSNVLMLLEERSKNLFAFHSKHSQHNLVPIRFVDAICMIFKQELKLERTSATSQK